MMDRESRLVVKSQHLRKPVERPSVRQIRAITNNRIEVAHQGALARAGHPRLARQLAAMPDYFDGVDVSRYQGASAIDSYDFAILNVEDPSIATKVVWCIDRGIPWDIYKWCYPGQSGAYMLNRAINIVNGLPRGPRAPRFWLDYEEGGVSPWQINEWYNSCNNAGVPTGLYIYLYLMNNQGVQFVRDGRIGGWLAYYPGNNSGAYYPSMSDTARARGADGHQYTSTNGTLDQNVFFDPAWFGASAPPPPPPPPPQPPQRKVQKLELVVGPRDGTIGNVAQLRDHEVGLLVEWTGNERDVFGMKIPSKAVDFLDNTHGIDVVYLGTGADANVNDLKGKVMRRLTWPEYNEPTFIRD